MRGNFKIAVLIKKRFWRQFESTKLFKEDVKRKSLGKYSYFLERESEMRSFKLLSITREV